MQFTDEEDTAGETFRQAIITAHKEEIKLNYGNKTTKRNISAANPVPDNESYGSGAHKRVETSRG